MKHFLQEARRNIISALGVVLIIFGIIILISLYTPQRRYDRAMAKADKAMTAQKYEKAVDCYRKAISAKGGFAEPYLGILVSKEALQSEDLAETFNAGLEVLAGLDETYRENNKELLVEYVLHENIVYADDIDARLDALEKGFEITLGAEDVRRILRECELEKLDLLRNGEKYEEALSLLERFELKTAVKKSDYESDIFAEKEFAETKKTLLIRVYNALKDVAFDNTGTDFFEYDFSDILEIDGSDQAEEVSSSFLSDRYRYIVDGDSEKLTGKGAGLYTFGEKYRTEKGGVAIAYYFYVGNFIDGKREGYGVFFTKNGENMYVAYAGNWKDDLPEGEGTRYEINSGTEGEGGYKKKMSGNWAKGLAEGEISVEVREDIYEDVVFSGTVSAKEGVGAPVATETAEYVVLNIRTGNLIAVLSSSTEGYDLMIALWQLETEKLEALGVY